MANIEEKKNNDNEKKSKYLENPITYWAKVTWSIIKWFFIPITFGLFISTLLLKFIYSIYSHSAKYINDPIVVRRIQKATVIISMILFIGLLAGNTVLQWYCWVHVPGLLGRLGPWWAKFVEVVVFGIVLLGTIYVITFSFLLKLILFIAYNKKIKKEIMIHTAKKNELNSLGLKTGMDESTLRYKKIYKFISYESFRNALRHYEIININKQLHSSETAGYKIARGENIFYLLEYWIYHTLFIGTRRSGITNHVLEFTNSIFKNKCQYIGIDINADAVTMNSMKAIAKNSNTELTIFDFSGYNASIKYDPFKDKTPSQISKMVLSSFVTLSNKNEKIFFSQSLSFIIDLMINSNIEITFNSLLQHLDISFLKKTYMNDNQQLLGLLKNKNIVSHIINFRKTLHTFINQFGSFFSYDKNDKKRLSIVDILKNNKSALYFNIPDSHANESTVMLQRLIIADLLESCENIESHDITSDIKPFAIAYLNLHKNFFLEAAEVPAMLNYLTSKKVGLVFEISDNDVSDNIDILSEILLAIKNVFYHKIVNQEILSLIENNILPKLHPVNRNYEEYETSHKYHDDDDDGSNSAFMEGTRNKISKQLIHLQTASCFFSTIHYNYLSKSENIYDADIIIYNLPFSVPHFSITPVKHEKK